MISVESNARPGGWSPVSPADAKVKIAAQRAIAARSLIEKNELTLATIENAQRQVVAGLNYKPRLSVVQDGKTNNASATVWAKLDGNYQLTAWTWE